MSDTSRIVYRDMGRFYDQLWPPVRGNWYRARKRLLRGILPRVGSVCELGCGTGNASIEFARQGYRVFAVDLSAAMLRVARQKARKAGVAIRAIRADMRSFRLPEKVDLVASEWGAVNHIPRKTDLARVLRAVARALRPGGYFLFDVNHRPVFEELWTVPLVWETREVFVVHQGGYDRGRDKAWSDSTWFIAGPRGQWKRYGQYLEEVHWSPAEIRRMLLRAGFGRVRAYDFTALTSNTKPPRRLCGYRTVFLARKELE